MNARVLLPPPRSRAHGSLEVALRGAPGETVALVFAARDAADAGGGFACHARNATIGADGTSSVSFNG